MRKAYCFVFAIKYDLHFGMRLADRFVKVITFRYAKRRLKQHPYIIYLK